MKRERLSLTLLFACVLLFGVLCGSALTVLLSPAGFSCISAFGGGRTFPDALFFPLLIPVLLFTLSFSRFASFGTISVLAVAGGCFGFALRSTLAGLSPEQYAPLAVTCTARLLQAVGAEMLAPSAVTYAHLLRENAPSLTELQRLVRRFSLAAGIALLSVAAEQGMLALLAFAAP